MNEKLTVIMSPETVNEEGDIVPAQEMLIDRASWEANRLELEEDHPQFTTRSLGNIAAHDEAPKSIDSPINTELTQKPRTRAGYRTTAQRNARAHERRARDDRRRK